jgi:hypothetical protein
MGRRPKHQRRPKEFKPGTIAPWPADKLPAAEVAKLVRYVASGEHKDYHAPDGSWIRAHHSDKTKCAHFARSEWVRLQESLQGAIEASCVDEEFRGDFPTRAWAYVNGVLHEARLSNRSSGEYHGFPLEYPEQIPLDPTNLLRNAPRVEIAID